MYGGILEALGDLGKIIPAFPDQLLALFQLQPADIFSRRDLQMALEERGQVGDTDIVGGGNAAHREPVVDMVGDIGQYPVQNMIFIVDGNGSMQLFHPGILHAQDGQKQLLEL